MVNGSLADWLHHEIGERNPRSLTLIRRLNIAIDVASALDYLHHHCGTPLVHCDLKPSNILLDGEFVAHVSDFGLARFTQEATSGQRNSSGGIKGTIGYAAPEYGMGGAPSTYGDVYSYGILLLEIFTGKSPTDEVFTTSLSLHSFAKMAIPDHVMEIVDPVLFYHVQDDEMSGFSKEEIRKCLISVIEIGVSCSLEFPKERMDISRVINQLYSIKNVLLKG
ncbi:Non-specific serine/threonine protein kinase [Handroanthus impetiginosus]|uniref:non-specific serine/threonine protein kinase n=1 Tax=Handroanthus impetiginosus TaxID=429701 RepID=A0A2G9G4P0_9LAMI|nr:Non-specific serine/threonine protein kinase [Handroanthus impetiginosus]